MRTTESTSLHDHLEQKSTQELLQGIHTEDQKVPHAVGLILPKIEAFIDAAFEKPANVRLPLEWIMAL
jgi:N-acetylmuramic acid 6-phosphate etherase